MKNEKINPKSYTKHTILTASGNRIAEVLKRYWKLTYKDIEDKQEKLIDEAKKIFEV